MALIAPIISSLSCFASPNPNNPSNFVTSKFRSTIASSSPTNTTKISTPSYVYASVSKPLKRFDHKTSIEYLHELYIKKVKNILSANRDDPLESLEMIDAIQGLGIDLHFQHEISQTLHMIYGRECTQFYGYYGRDQIKILQTKL